MVASVCVVSRDVFFPVTNLATRYSDFLDVLEKRNADRLPAYQPNDYPIELQDGAHPPFGPIYGLYEPELEAFCNYLDENLTTGFIQPSKSPVEALILVLIRTSRDVSFLVRCYERVWIIGVSTKLRCIIVIPCP